MIQPLAMYNQFNNLHFNKSQNLDDFSAARVVVSFISSELVKGTVGENYSA